MRQSTAALIRHGDRLLFVRRPPGGDLGGLWELPGGKVDDGERPEEALLRELREELGVVGRVGDAVGEARFDHAGERFQLLGFRVEVDIESVVLHEHEEIGFFTPEEALALRLAPSDALLLAAVGERIR